jgi:YD repeat-containing protein
MADGAGSVSYAYKSNANLLASETRTFTGVSGSFAANYDYDKAGRLIETVYPSGRRVAHTYAASGFTVNREATLKTQPNTQTSLTTLATISVSAGTSGQTVSRTLGNGVVETLAFNRRSQLTDIDAVLSSTSLMNMAYSYGTTANTGRIQSRTDILQPEHSVNYTYDALHRLKQATAANASWSVSWGLDSYGNRTTQTPGGLATTVLGSPSMGYINNKNMAWSYDDFGNVTNDGVSSYAYNADNQMVSKGGGTVTYGYDGDGRRITKTAGGVTTFYLYGMTGLMSEFTTATGPQQAAAATDRLEYRIAEQTGTAVLLLNSSGLVTENNRVYQRARIVRVAPCVGSPERSPRSVCETHARIGSG